MREEQHLAKLEGENAKNRATIVDNEALLAQ